MLSNDRHSPNRDFVFPILFDDTGNWYCRYMGYDWYVFFFFFFIAFVGVVSVNGQIHGEVAYTEDFETINNILLLAMKIVEFILSIV